METVGAGRRSGGVLAETVRELADLEERARLSTPVTERIASRVTAATGTVTFVVINVVWFAAWIVMNLPGMPTQFDPFPFSFLTMIVSLEAIVLAAFVLISERSEAERAERRSQVEMEINILAEREVTKLVAMVAAIHEHLGLSQGEAEVAEMQQAVHLDHVADAIAAADAEVHAETGEPRPVRP